MDTQRLKTEVGGVTMTAHPGLSGKQIEFMHHTYISPGFAFHNVLQ